MITEFSVRKEIFEDTPHERLHFEVGLDGKEYQGYYKDGEISWFQMQPSQENHEIKIEDLEVEIQKRMVEWEDAERLRE